MVQTTKHVDRNKMIALVDCSPNDFGEVVEDSASSLLGQVRQSYARILARQGVSLMDESKVFIVGTRLS